MLKLGMKVWFVINEEGIAKLIKGKIKYIRKTRELGNKQWTTEYHIYDKNNCHYEVNRNLIFTKSPDVKRLNLKFKRAEEKRDLKNTQWNFEYYLTQLEVILGITTEEGQPNRYSNNFKPTKYQVGRIEMLLEEIK